MSLFMQSSPFAIVCNKLTNVITSVKRLAALVAVVALALGFAPSARADGDPAGDVLAQQTVFYGSALDLRSQPAAQLPALLEQAKAKGYELRVAAMSIQQDMGAIDYLWDDPLNYVDFLAQELAYRYQGRVLVIMPSGYAIYRLGHSSVRDQRVLDKLEPAGEDPAAVLPSALDAVVALARARAIALTVPDVAAPPGGVKQPGSHFASRAAAAQTGSGSRSTRAATSGGGSGAWLFALPVVALVAAAGVLIVRGRRRDRGAQA
jgi:hypothetical protein